MGLLQPGSGSCCAILLGASVLALPARAQSVAPTGEELKGATRHQATPPRATLKVSGDVERSPCPLADSRFAGVTVTVNDVQFDHLQGATPAEMRATWGDLAGRPQPVAILCEIRDRAATLLRRKGYLAAVQVPVQRIENGVVHLEMLYGRLVAVRAKGQTGGAESKIAAYLEPLTRDPIFQRGRAERALLLARDLPGYNVQLTLRPAGTGPGELIGEVTVLRRPFALDLTVQNLAAKETGRWGGQLRGSLFGVTGLGDATTFDIYSTSDFKEQQILQVEHEFRPGASGLVVSGQATWAWTRPDIGASGPANLKARTFFGTLALSYPLVRSQTHNWTLGGGLDIINQDVQLIGPLTRDRLRVAFLRAEFDSVDVDRNTPRWHLAASAELRKGLGILGAISSCARGGCAAGDIPPSRSDGDPAATLARLSATAELALGRSAAVAVSPRAQIAFEPLLSFEEYTAGNYTVGRGYDPGTLQGDSGAGVAVELRGPRWKLLPRSEMRFQPFLFTDAAWTWNRNTPGQPEELWSAGAGVRGGLSDRVRLDAALAVPLRKAGLANRKPGVRLLVSLTARLLPWGVM